MVGHFRQLVYASTATRLLREPELVEILEVSRANNAKWNVSGLLLYAEGSFIQVIEGEPKTIERLARKIRRDPRHRRFLTLLDRMVEDRDFEGSSMAFMRVSVQELNQIGGYLDWSADMTTKRRSGAALKLIECFRRTAPGLALSLRS